MNTNSSCTGSLFRLLQVPIALLVLNDGLSKGHDDIVTEVKAKVRHDIGAIASLSGATVVEQLPKTRSGKVRALSVNEQIMSTIISNKLKRNDIYMYIHMI